MSKYSKMLYIAATIFLTAFIIGCNDDDNSSSANAFRSELMTIHASPDAPAVDLLIDNVVEIFAELIPAIPLFPSPDFIPWRGGIGFTILIPKFWK